MRTLRIVAVAAVCVSLLGLAACKKDSAEAGKEAVKAVKVPDQPDKVITAGIEAIKNNKPVEVYAMLPESYQKDVQGLVAAATAGMDKEIFEMSVQILDKAVSCIDKHGDKIAKEMGAQMPFDAKVVFKQVKEVHGLLKDAKVFDYDAMKKLDAAGFLATSGSKLMAHGMDAFKTFNKKDYDEFMGMLGKISATTKKAEGDKAEVEIKMGDKAQNVTFKKVDGRWVPEDLAAMWPGMIKEAKAEIEKGVKEAAANKAQMKPMMQMVLTALTQFEETGDLAGLKGMMPM